MAYMKKFEKPYSDGYKDKPDLTTPITADILNMQDETFEAIEDFLVNLDTTGLTDDVAIKNSLTVGSRNKANGNYTVSHGENCEASSPCSHAEGSSCIASEQASHAEGTRTTASGNMAHSEGNETIASGTISHAEGYKTIASGVSSHAEGISTKANGYMAHSEGNTTVADGAGSHAEGYGTKATADFQHVQGKYNLEDTEKKYAHIVGGGSSDSDRKNIHTIDWNGNAEFAGDVTNGNGVSLDGLDGKIAELASSGISRLIVDSLPTEDIKTNVIYFLPLSSVGENNIYEEYMYINEKWELIGTTQVDLSQYYTKEESDDLLAEKANKTAFENHANDKDIHMTAAEKKKYITADVDNLVNYYDKTITDQKLANIDLTDYLKKTGDSSDTTVEFTEPTELSQPITGEKLKGIIGKVSLAIKNLKKLITLMGTTDISSIGDGTVTGAVSDVNSNLGKKQDASTAINTGNIGSQSVNHATYSEYSNKTTQIQNFSGFEFNQSTEVYGPECTWYDKNGLRIGIIVPHCTGKGGTDMVMVADRGKLNFPCETFISSIHLGNDTNFIYTEKGNLCFRFLKEDGSISYVTLESFTEKANQIVRVENYYTGNISTGDNIKITMNVPSGYHIIEATRAWTSGFVGSCYIETFDASANQVSIWVSQGNNGNIGTIYASVLAQKN